MQRFLIILCALAPLWQITVLLFFAIAITIDYICAKYFKNEESS
jgi:hypothetical protein